MDNIQLENLMDIVSSQTSLIIPIGEYRVDTNELLTDDLACIFIKLSNDKKIIKELVSYTETLPYTLKIDIIYYISQNKNDYKKLMKIKSFNKMVDGFAKTLLNTKLV